MARPARLYGAPGATNVRRVTIYMAEKGIDLPQVDLDLASGENRTAAFLARNPAGKVPVLEWTDGTTLSESAAIVECLEELHPDPPMIGADPAARGQVRALERVAAELIIVAGIIVANTHPFFARHVAQDAAVADALRPKVAALLAVLGAHRGARDFLAGPSPTVADCTLFALVDNCRRRFDWALDAAEPGLSGWYARFSARPGARC